MANEMVVRETPSELITLAIEKGADLEKLQKLLEIKREYDMDVARQEYHKAMTAFKSEAPTIIKDKSVSFGVGKAAYKHASLFQVATKISVGLAKFGLSASWRVAQNGTISVTTRVTHELGHFEETTLSAPSDNSGSKNAIQAIGSTISYLERYGLLAICGLASADQDDDGNTVVTEFISEQQLSQLRDLMNDKDIKEDKFCALLKVESLVKLPASQFQQAVAAINAKKK